MAPGAIAQIQKVADATPHEAAPPRAARRQRAAQPAAERCDNAPTRPVEQDVQSWR